MPRAPRRIRIGVLGLGYWGVNVARNLDRIEDCELAWCCDSDPEREEAARAAHPAARFSGDLGDLLADEDLDAIAVVTPVPTHAALAARVLEAGKACFVEKPLAQRLDDAERLTALAAAAEVPLMVGHLLEYHPALHALQRLIGEGELGELHYLYSQRLNLGRLRADENALWSLGAHDVSMLIALAGEMPAEVAARGESFVRDGVEDVVFGYLRFAAGVVAHMHLSWLDPRKERRLTVVGSRRMAAFDDLAERKLTVYDKGFDPDAASVDDYVARSGETRSPVVGGEEPLRLELEHFVDCVAQGRQPRSDGRSGARVVSVLEALQRSLETGGAPVAPVPAVLR